ncbi:hypothetical protein [uncultured Aquabacterium sp.]|uniref:hypothetical protein n=1 Tax=Aquabacterium sp. TaxID=1872578 RepID=UPI0025FB5F21|nr:hypothetical protein [uncultured Aquabacterium sp.]
MSPSPPAENAKPRTPGTASESAPDRPLPVGWRIAAWLAALAVLAGVFALYARSGLVFDLATRLWSCF